jgi:hypothetical protein
MRNLRKLTAAVLAIAIVLTSMTAVFAAGDTTTTIVNADKAATLKDLGLYAGTDATDVKIGLDGVLTTQDSLIFLAKIFGYFDAAGKLSADEVTEGLAKFADADKISDYAKNVVAYSAINGILSGSTKDGKFYVGAKDTVTAARFATFILKQMGYTVPKYTESAVQLSEVKGSQSSATVTGELTRDAAIGIIYGALTAEQASGKTVIAGIVGDDAALKAIAEKAGLIKAETPTALIVNDVTAPNLKQVKVVFNKEVDSSTVIDANFTVYKAANAYTDIATTTATYALQSDKKTVIITLDTGAKLDNNSTFEVKVSNVKDLAGNLVTAFDKTGISSTDISTPVLVDAKVSGPRTIVATFSEPVYSYNNTPAADFTVDGGNYYISKADISASNSTVTLTLGAPLTSGDHTITVASSSTDLKDYADYPVIIASKTITATPVTTAPVATIASQSQNKVVLKFSAPVNNVEIATINAVYNNVNGHHTVAAADPNGTTYSVDGNIYNDTWDLVFAALPAGTNNLYITSDSAKPIADAWGNTFATTVVTLPLSIISDNTAPTVKSASIALDSNGNNHELTVVYSEDVDASNVGVTLYDSSNVLQTLSTTPVYNNSTYTAVYSYAGKLAGGAYTLTLKNIVDKSPAANKLETYTNTITVADVVAPGIKAAYKSNEYKILVTYSEAVNTAISGLVSSYQVTSGSPAVKNTINSVNVIDTKNVILNVASALTSAPTVAVANVTDLAGNSVSSNFSNAQEVAVADTGAKVNSVKAISTTQIKVEFDRVLTGLGNAGMSLVAVGNTTGTAVSAIGYTESSTINSSNQTVAIFHLATALNEAAQDTVTLKNVIFSIDYTKSTAKDLLGVAPASDASKIVVDEILPTVYKVEYKGQDTITITFNEDLDADTINKATGSINGFSLKNGTIGSALLTAPKVITIKAGKDANGNPTYFTQGTTSVSYSGLQGIQDIAGNALAAFTDKVAN